MLSNYRQNSMFRDSGIKRTSMGTWSVNVICGVFENNRRYLPEDLYFQLNMCLSRTCRSYNDYVSFHFCNTRSVLIREKGRETPVNVHEGGFRGLKQLQTM